MTIERMDAAIDRAFGRTQKVLDAMEGGDLTAAEEINEIASTMPWDLVAIGQEFVRDQIQTERDTDNDTFQPLRRGN